MQRISAVFGVGLVLACHSLETTVLAEVPYRIQIVDEQSGRGVPLVELATVNNIRFYTDSLGNAAIDEPGLEGLDVFFQIRSHGYEYPADGFGSRGRVLRVEAGESDVVPIRRVNIAERLYRLTGAGIYRDSLMTGQPVPIEAPLLNGQVFGCDATINVVYCGKLFWFWGDTNRPSYPLGNFYATGATSLLPSDGGLDPAVGVDLQVFIGEDGFARGMAKFPGEGATWLAGLTVLEDPATGAERMFAGYVRVRAPFDVYQTGLAEYDDEQESFRSVAEFGRDPIIQPHGHPIRQVVDGTEYVHFGTTIPFIRVRAQPESLANIDEYETYTCLRAGSRLRDADVDRDPEGRIRFGWKRDTPAIGPMEQKALVESGALQPHEGLFQLRHRDTGKPILAHFGSCYWNEHRQRYVLVFVEGGGVTSNLGEVWYTEGDSPLGPWAYAVKIITHDQYTFYNPKQHPMLAQDGGRLIYIDGTYSHDFSGNPDQTPRYDYNPIMYRLDLADPRLILPVAVYRHAEANHATWSRFIAGTPDDASSAPDRSQIAFFACDRAYGTLIPVYRDDARSGQLTAADDAEGEQPIAFYALPGNAAGAPEATAPLYEYVAEDGRCEYSTDPAADYSGYRRNEHPVCRVWPNPFVQSQ